LIRRTDATQERIDALSEASLGLFSAADR
jgi:hypothetical protein